MARYQVRRARADLKVVRRQVEEIGRALTRIAEAPAEAVDDNYLEAVTNALHDARKALTHDVGEQLAWSLAQR
jgi:hypothetical protein